jgi:hypothetical protein
VPEVGLGLLEVDALLSAAKRELPLECGVRVGIVLDLVAGQDDAVVEVVATAPFPSCFDRYQSVTR